MYDISNANRGWTFTNARNDEKASRLNPFSHFIHSLSFSLCFLEDDITRLPMTPPHRHPVTDLAEGKDMKFKIVTYCSAMETEGKTEFDARSA